MTQEVWPIRVVDVIGSEHEPSPAYQRHQLIDRLVQDAGDRGGAAAEFRGDLPDALAPLGQDVDGAALHLP